MQNNTTRHEPFFLTYGREARLPIELQYKTYQETEVDFDQQLLQRIYSLLEKLPEQVINAKKNIDISQERSKERHDQKLPKV